MDSTKSMPSVIGMLMGLDDQQPHQPVLRRQRVLSENYLNKSAVLGMYERSMLNSGHSSSIPTSKRKGRQKDVQQEIEKDSNRIVFSIANRIVCSKEQSSSTKHPLITEKLHSEEFYNVAQDLNNNKFLSHSEHTELLPDNWMQDQQLDDLRDHSDYYGAEKFLSTVRDRKCIIYSNTSEVITPQGNALRSLQKLNRDSPSSGFREFDIYSSPKLLKSRSYSKVKILYPSSRIVVLRPSSEMALNLARCTSLTSEFVSSVSGFRKCCEFALSKSGGENMNGEVAREIDNVSLNNGLQEIVDQKHSAHEGLVKRETTVLCSPDKVPNWKKGRRNSRSFANGSSLCRLGGKQIFDKCRKRKTSKIVKLDDIEKVVLSNIGKHCCSSLSRKDSRNIIDLGSDTSFKENGNIPGHVICRLSSATDLNKDSEMKLMLKCCQVIHNEKECHLWKDDILEDSSLIKSVTPCISETMVVENQQNNITISPSEFKEPLSNTSIKHDSPAHVSETTSVQTLPYCLNEEGFVISNFTNVDSEFPSKWRAIIRPSPNSSLLSHLQEEKTLVSQEFECTAADFCEETCSEGSGLAVSSDDDSKEASFHFCQDTEKIFGRYRVEESKNFSYLLDILDEAELTCINSENYSRVWHSLEYPVDPSVFEVLEKKYGKQTSWEKSERRLLFDRINVGLKEILNIQIGICSFEISLRRRFIAALRRNEIEEELWMFLTSEEKDACNYSSDKGLVKEIKLLELSEDVQAICRDIENDLFDELVGETVTIAGL